METISMLADFAAIGSLVVTLCVHWRIVYRDRKRETIAEFNRIRNKYPDINSYSSEKEKTAYLTELERFCVGVNSNIYDHKILAKMSKSFLMSQYSYLKEFVSQRKEVNGQETAYIEYTKVMEKFESK